MSESLLVSPADLAPGLGHWGKANSGVEVPELLESGGFLSGKSAINMATGSAL